MELYTDNVINVDSNSQVLVTDLGDVTESDDESIESPIPQKSKRLPKSIKIESNKKQKKQHTDIPTLLSTAISMYRQENREGNPMGASPPVVNQKSTFHQEWDRRELFLRLRVVAKIMSTGQMLESPDETMAHYLSETHEYDDTILGKATNLLVNAYAAPQDSMPRFSQL